MKGCFVSKQVSLYGTPFQIWRKFARFREVDKPYLIWKVLHWIHERWRTLQNTILWLQQWRKDDQTVYCLALNRIRLLGRVRSDENIYNFLARITRRLLEGVRNDADTPYLVAPNITRLLRRFGNEAETVWPLAPETWWQFLSSNNLWGSPALFLSICLKLLKVLIYFQTVKCLNT